MKITREKRPDRVICKWKDYEVELNEDGDICVWGGSNYSYFPKREIPNLIKALEEVIK